MATAEPGRKAPYGKDLRWRMVYQRLAMNLELADIASNLNVSISTVSRTIALFMKTGSVAPRKKICRINFCFTEEEELLIIGLIFEHPSMYLDEIVREIVDLLGIEVSLSTVCRLLKRYGITRKKVRQVAQQRCYTLRGMYIAHIYNFDLNMLVWLDETGTDKRDQLRKYGYALRGVTPHYHRLLSRGQRINAIACMCKEGLVALELVNGNVNGDIFYDFVRGCLIPNMQIFPNPHSVLIMDNCSIHHTDEVTSLLQNLGIVAMYLPPYSPDLMPLEESFSYVKNYLRRHDEVLQVISDPRDIINEAFLSISQEKFYAWIEHAGYNMQHTI
jgi:transposase